MMQRLVAALAVFVCAPALPAQEAGGARLRPLPAVSKGMKTGPDPGQPIPEFALPDQDGHMRTFAALRGRNGLVLVFVRSADW